jgi:hypothetical protein
MDSRTTKPHYITGKPVSPEVEAEDLLLLELAKTAAAFRSECHYLLKKCEACRGMRKLVCVRCEGPLLDKRRICESCRKDTLEAYEGHRDAAGRAELEVFAEEFLTCWCCGWPLGDIGGEIGDERRYFVLHIHHILRGPNRKHVRSNLSRLCSGCHDRVHNNEIPLSHVLWLKQRHDPSGHDLAELEKIKGSPLPEPECAPERSEWKP